MDDEGAISCLGRQDEDRDALPAEEWEMSPQRWADSSGIHWDPLTRLIPVFISLHFQAALFATYNFLANTYLSTMYNKYSLINKCFRPEL